ncbi:MAG TPA: hypothetical protein VF620_05790 [Allosphingosinicella sp.]|jgi:hypothetical protein
MRFIALSSLLVLAACGDQSNAPQEARHRDKPAQVPMPELERPAETGQDREDSGDAATALRRYYSRVQAGDYDSAWAMRSGEAGDEARQRFAANFRAYESYQADVGTPSEPVQSNGWAYVEVPVMIRGTFKGGKPFSSAGSVTVRKATSGAGGGWHIYAGEGR